MVGGQECGSKITPSESPGAVDICTYTLKETQSLSLIALRLHQLRLGN